MAQIDDARKKEEHGPCECTTNAPIAPSWNKQQRKELCVSMRERREKERKNSTHEKEQKREHRKWNNREKKAGIKLAAHIHIHMYMRVDNAMSHKWVNLYGVHDTHANPTNASHTQRDR